MSAGSSYVKYLTTVPANDLALNSARSPATICTQAPVDVSDWEYFFLSYIDHVKFDGTSRYTEQFCPDITELTPHGPVMAYGVVNVVIIGVGNEL